MTIDLKIYEIEEDDTGRRYRFKLPSDNGLVSGIERLAQQVSKSLLTTPGSDKRFPNWGGGLDSLPVSLHREGEVLQEYINKITYAVTKVEQDIKTKQSINAVPSDEALTSLDILDISVVNFDTIVLDVRIETVLKQTLDLPITL